MIPVLLDTHTFIWWNGSSIQLSPQTRLICADKNNRLILSMASIWEMQIKHQLGKLNFNQPLPDLIRRQQENNGLEILPVRLAHIYALSALPHHHKDPFDRIIIAQASVENIAIVTADEIFKQYPVQILG